MMDRTRFFIRVAAIYALIGAFMGSHMAGGGGLQLSAIHAHILVVGWLSLFAFGIYYKVFSIPKKSKLATAHVWTAFFGVFGLTAGMWLYYTQPIPGMNTFNTIFFIVGGTILLIAFVLFAIMTFIHGKLISEDA
ncbi:hypothetical protein BN982_00963 [Halobacillus karajensis]|uniref:Cbb3-type cytochrome oxidase, subunit 1 n=2 Tax=Halobacillus karajensis TaxID=195088 RepID=A0A024P5J8_9BACI|nr:hypothetical protein BN982_00963 [Halobacillus karajensis]CDQ23242.1 hypothetical protein BN983_01465 [Halobacillus karajensis]CDQ26724.1 hypothetical protein BN981_00945 [Halobacillus karajensis]